MCPSPNADSIMRAKQDVQRELNSYRNLRDLNIIHNLMTTASKSNGQNQVELLGWGPEEWVKPGSCLQKPVVWRVPSVEIWVALRPWRNNTGN